MNQLADGLKVVRGMKPKQVEPRGGIQKNHRRCTARRNRMPCDSGSPHDDPGCGGQYSAEI